MKRDARLGCLTVKQEQRLRNSLQQEKQRNDELIAILASVRDVITKTLKANRQQARSSNNEDGRQ